MQKTQPPLILLRGLGPLALEALMWICFTHADVKTAFTVAEK